MPCPTNSRTTENPYASTCPCPPRPKSDPRPPALTPPTPLYSATFGVSAVSTSPTRRPAARIRSSSAADLQTITAPPLPPDHSTRYQPPQTGPPRPAPEAARRSQRGTSAVRGNTPPAAPCRADT